VVDRIAGVAARVAAAVNCDFHNVYTHFLTSGGDFPNVNGDFLNINPDFTVVGGLRMNVDTGCAIVAGG